MPKSQKPRKKYQSKPQISIDHTHCPSELKITGLRGELWCKTHKVMIAVIDRDSAELLAKNLAVKPYLSSND